MKHLEEIHRYVSIKGLGWGGGMGLGGVGVWGPENTLLTFRYLKAFEFLVSVNNQLCLVSVHPD